MNNKVTKDLSDNIKAAAILADFFGYKVAYTDTPGSRGGQILNDKSGSNKVITFKGSNNIPLKIGDNWYFADTDGDITLPNDLDDYLADVVLEDGSNAWTASANVTASTNAGQVKLAIDAAFATGLIGYRDIAAADLTITGKNSISLLITSSANLAAGVLRLCIDEHSACVSPSYFIVPALKANVQTRIKMPLSAITAADLLAVISIGLDAVSDPGAINVWLDDIKTTSTEAGQDYFVYACDNSGTLVFKLSKASTYPAGFSAATSRKLGGFHTLARAVGTIAGHTLSTYDTADISPYSIWDLKHRPRSAPAGMVYSPRTGKWVDIYLVSGTGASSLSVNGGTISDTRSWLDFVDDAGSVGKRLAVDHEFQCMAMGSNEETAILGAADPVTTGSHLDTAYRRMISNIGAEDMCGALNQWLLDQSYRYDPNGTSNAAAQVCAVTYAASPGANPVYLKYGADGDAYLCCNLDAGKADKFLTFGTAYKVILKHDANAATGGLQVYFDDDGTAPNRLLVNNSLNGGKDSYISANNPDFWLPVIHNANAATVGTAITYDDGADNRLESACAGGVTANLDLSSGTAFSYYDLPGAKGSLYMQGSTGDVKLLAGGSWNASSSCGSRCRAAAYYRWYTNTYFGARFVSEPQ